MKIRTIKYILWIAFLIILIVGYFYIPRPNSKHLKLIPSSAKAIIIADLYTISEDYYNLLEKYPDKLIDIIDFKKKDLIYKDKRQRKNIGFNPLNKIALYIDKYEDLDLICAILPIYNRIDFLSFINFNNEQISEINADFGQITFFKKSKISVLSSNESAILILPLKENNNISLQTAKSYFENINNSFLNDNESFNKISEITNHIVYNVSSINNNFMKSINGKLHFKLGGIYTDCTYELADSSIFKNISSTSLQLKENEFARFSTYVNPNIINDILNPILPNAFSKLSSFCSGGINISMFGFTNKNLNKDKVSYMSSLVNIPKITCSLSIKDESEVIKILKSDSNFIKNTDNLFEYEVIKTLKSDSNFTNNSKNVVKYYLASINDTIFITINNRTLILSNTKEGLTHSNNNYNTLSCKVDVEKLIEAYPKNNFTQKMIVNQIRQSEIKQLDIHSYEKQNTKMLLKGNILIGDSSEHVFFKIIPLIKKKM